MAKANVFDERSKVRQLAEKRALVKGIAQIHESFSETLRQYREDRGLTQTELAVLCRVSRRTIARIEAGLKVSGRIHNFILKLIQIK